MTHVDAGLRDFNLALMGADASPRAIAEAVMTPPFGPGKRVVVVDNPAFLSPRTKSDAEEGTEGDAAKVETGVLEGLLGSWPATGVLIIVAAKVDGR